MSSMKRLMYKLQTALCVKGVKVKINQLQSWSDKSERMVTKYVISREVFDRKTQKARYVAVCESYQAAEAVQALARLLNEGGGGG